MLTGTSDTTSEEIYTLAGSDKAVFVKASVGGTLMIAPLSWTNFTGGTYYAVFTYEDQSNLTYKYCTMTIVGSSVTLEFKDGYATASQIPTDNASLTNGAGYITGIDSTDVTDALGYTPYDADNPNGYITGITGTDVTDALGFTPYSDTNPDGFTSDSALSNAEIDTAISEASV